MYSSPRLNLVNLALMLIVVAMMIVIIQLLGRSDKLDQVGCIIVY